MDNYKIKVKDEAESKEAQELFFELGYQWCSFDKGIFFETTSGWIYAKASSKHLFCGSYIKEDVYQELTLVELRQLFNAEPPQDPALISGAEALRALADGQSVEWQDDNGIWWPLGVGWTWNQIVNSLNGIKALRLKPQTIKLELELPKPFKPKEDGYVYIIDDNQVSGYRKYYFVVEGDNELDFIGVWHTEDEIKQVVEQLRKIRGAS